MSDAPAPHRPVHTISVVIETHNEASAPDVSLRDVLRGLARQTWPADRLEILVVVARGDASFSSLPARHPNLRIVESDVPTYYGMKCAGIDAARGDAIAVLDSDTEPVPGWAESFARRIEAGADAVAGKTRYPKGTPFARTFDFFNFGYIQGDARGAANGFLPNNVGFRREVILEHPFDIRLRRSGAAHLLGHKLIALGYRVEYEPAMHVIHNSYGVVEEMRMRVKSGYDCVNLARFDEEEVIGESRYLRRTPLLLAAVFWRRVAFDVRAALWNREDLGISWLHVPWFLAISPLIRGLELGAGLLTLARPDYFPKRYGW